jgi:hypothetical protein
MTKATASVQYRADKLLKRDGTLNAWAESTNRSYRSGLDCRGDCGRSCQAGLTSTASINLTGRSMSYSVPRENAINVVVQPGLLINATESAIPTKRNRWHANKSWLALGRET